MTSYKIIFTCSRFCSITSLLRISFLPMRSFGSSIALVPNGLAPSIFPCYSSSFKVFSYGNKTKGSYWNDGITFSIWEILCLYNLSFLLYLLQTFPISLWTIPKLHPTIDLHFLPPLIMPWILPEVKYYASRSHYFF